MHPDLEKFVDMALDDGILTDKEREILFRKAEKLGEDLDEFEMELEFRLGKIDKGNKKKLLEKEESSVVDEFPFKSFIDKLHEIDDLIANPDKNKPKTDNLFGTVNNLMEESNFLTSGVKAWKDLRGSEKKTLKKRKIDFISSYPLPKSTQDIIEMSNLCINNFNSARDRFLGQPTDIERMLKSAWKGKAIQCNSKLRIEATSDNNLAPIVNDLELRTNNLIIEED